MKSTPLRTMRIAIIFAYALASINGQGLTSSVQLVNVTAQGGGDFIPNPPWSLHVSNDTLMAFLEGDAGVFQYQLDTSGNPTLITNYTVAGGAYCPAVGGADDALVVASSGSNTLPTYTWTRPSGGSATWTSGGSVTLGNTTTFTLSLTADGAFLYRGSTLKTIYVYTVGPTPGTYTQASTTIVPITSGSSQMSANMVFGNANFYHLQQGGGAFAAVLYQYAITSGTGALTPLSTASVTMPAPFTGRQFSPDGNNFYVLGLDSHCTLYQASRASDGSITFGPSYTTSSTVPCKLVTVSRDGAWLFIGSTDGTVYQFSRNSTTGDLTPLQCPFYPGVCPSGTKIYALDTSTYSTSDLTVYAGCYSLALNYIAYLPFSATTTTLPCPTSTPTTTPTPSPTDAPTPPTATPTVTPTRTPTRVPTKKH